MNDLNHIVYNENVYIFIIISVRDLYQISLACSEESKGRSYESLRFHQTTVSRFSALLSLQVCSLFRGLCSTWMQQSICCWLPRDASESVSLE